jgi:hypothetical protein
MTCDSWFWDGDLADRASVLPREPLLYAVHVVAVATVEPPYFLASFVLFLRNICSD